MNSAWYGIIMKAKVLIIFIPACRYIGYSLKAKIILVFKKSYLFSHRQSNILS